MAKKVQTPKFVLFLYICANLKDGGYKIATNHTVNVVHHYQIENISLYFSNQKQL